MKTKSAFMSWADRAKEVLRGGVRTTVRPRGYSMRPQVNDGDRVTLEPAEPGNLAVGDIVLVCVKGHDYLHLIKAIDGGRFQIGNNRGRINGWVGKSAIYGRAIKIERT